MRPSTKRLKRHIYIVMEYCDGGDLSSFIKKKHQLPEQICRQFLQQLALALRYLRNNNVSHMDLKPQNLLLMRQPRLTLKVGGSSCVSFVLYLFSFIHSVGRLATQAIGRISIFTDFGFAQHISSSEQKFAIRGSPLYMAPEILLKRKYDARVDLWSVGVIMYECLFGRAPYSSGSFQELAEKIKDCKPIELPKGPHVSHDCKDLLMSLLRHDPDQRITFDEFFAHDFLDLAHAPTKENYDKAVEIIQKAVKMDAEKNAKEAFHLYCEALRYFIPILTSETDPKREESLRLRINDYINRAEVLKASCTNNDKDKNKCVEQEHKGNCRNVQGVPSLSRSPTLAYHELRTLSKSTTSMPDALEIGDIAELYLAEGKYALALEKFQACLGILVPLLRKEPPGRRRDLLHKQVMNHYYHQCQFINLLGRFS
ncbi:serine/threonine-protein kinase ULK3 isoform X3 [Ceratina calcarata]|uniref:Serine/threonine-protein kinase ULK3 n=1 Tax=Ceratina calcarata TaxID=156304 RepID=A0AAJ7N4H4_9HYME|nr:serine/threonine-protein kinase ULK3 isoform X3 [Ceratina calcarata]